MSPPSRDGRLLTITLVLALAARLTWILLSAGTPAFPKYFILGEKLAAAGWVPNVVFASNPLYSYLVGFLARFFSLQETGLRVLQAGAATATVYLGWSAARALAGNVAAAVTALILALYPTLILMDTQALPFVWVNLANAGALLLLVKTGESRAPGYPVAAGALLGVSALLTPNMLLVVPLVLPCLLLAEGRREWGRSLAKFARVALACAAVVSPITLLNRSVEGELVLVTASGGSTLFLGNSAANDNPLVITPPPIAKQLELAMDPRRVPETEMPEHLAYRKAAEWVAGERLTAKGASRFYTREVLAYARREPGRFLLGIARKARHFFHSYESHDTESAHLRSAMLAVPQAPFFVAVWALALWGVAVSRRLWRRLLLPGALVVPYVVSAVGFYITCRLRLPVLLPMAVFAGLGFRDLSARVKQGDRRSVGAFLAAAAAFAVFSAWPTGSVRQARKLGDFNRLFSQGSESLARGDRASGLEELRRAAAAYPPGRAAVADFLRPYAAAEDAGRLLATLAAPAAEEPDGPRDRAFRERLEAGIAEQKRGDCAAALRQYGLALERSPYDWGVFARRAQCQAALAQWPAALADLESSFAYGGKWQPQIHRRFHEMGVAAWNAGDAVRAREYARRALFVEPGYRPARELEALVAGARPL